jgi:GNAT superfamily N-acetyltransferase
MPPRPKTPAPPQRPPGELPACLTPEQVYAERGRPHESEAIWHWPVDFTVPYAVVRLTPEQVMQTFLAWDGRPMKRAMKRPARPKLIERYAADGSRGTWAGYLVMSGPVEGRDLPSLLDGLHRAVAFDRAGVVEFYAIDLAQPVVVVPNPSRPPTVTVHEDVEEEPEGSDGPITSVSAQIVDRGDLVAHGEVKVGSRGDIVNTTDAPLALLREPIGTYAYVRGVEVSYERRRTGLGRRVMQAMLERVRALGARAVYLKVEPFNGGPPKAVLARFYESFGFERIVGTDDMRLRW